MRRCTECTAYFVPHPDELQPEEIDVCPECEAWQMIEAGVIPKAPADHRKGEDHGQ